MDYFSEQKLLGTPPVKRAAYSDRVAWILAEISRLVYEPLPAEVTVAKMVEEIKSAVFKGEAENTLDALIQKALQKGVTESSKVAEELKKNNFELLEPFAENGTEAILVKLAPSADFEGMLVLAFRGTQPTIKDIFTDIKTDLVSAPGGGRVHRGFLDAFQEVEPRIREALERHKGLPVYITGHSLGGALALVATRYFCSDSTGATYTYGCPRVADDTFFTPIKTPVYRIVNAADGVPKVPFGYGFTIVLSLIRLIPFNGTKQISEFLRRYFMGYTHYGNLTFLSAPANEVDDQGIPFKGLKVTKSPNIFWCANIILKQFLATKGKAIASDHRMQEYSQKLMAYAQRRNRH